MKVYEYGERCPHEGVFWSELTLANNGSYMAMKTAIVAKFELNLLLTAEALDEHDDEDFIAAHLERKKYDAKRLNQARACRSMDDLLKIDRVFVRERSVSEYVGCDYWSLLAKDTVRDLKG